MTDEPPITAGDGGGGGKQPGPIRRFFGNWAKEAPNVADDGCWSWVPDGCDGCDGCDALSGCDGCDGCSGCDLGLFALVHLLFVGRRGGPVEIPAAMALDPSMPRLTRWVLTLLRLYKRWVSPRLPMVCRYTPSCSAYAAEAVRRHGVRRGLRLGYRRIRRCNPAGGRGHDPVPEAEPRAAN